MYFCQWHTELKHNQSSSRSWGLVAEQKHSVMYTDIAMPMPDPYRWHLMNDWQRRILFSLSSHPIWFLGQVVQGFPYLFFRIDGNSVHAENLLVHHQQDGYTCHGNQCPNRNTCWSQESLTLLVRGSFPAAWFTLAPVLTQATTYSSLEAADLCLSHILLQNKQS